MPHKNLPSTGTAKRLQIGLAFSALLFVAGCVAHAGSYGVFPAPAPAPHANVPPGHMPPPGMCRVWFPNKPPGQQPPPGSCHELQYKVPPGAYLVYG